MKYRFSIIAPHPDDEFIGCYSFIKKYANYIDTVVFVTNGERSAMGFPDALGYIATRRTESTEWLHSLDKNIQIHYLNYPDGIKPNDDYLQPYFQKINNTTSLKFLVDKTSKIVGNTVVLCPALENHPSHVLAYSIAEILSNKRIFYNVHSILNSDTDKKPGVYSEIKETMGFKFFTYTTVFEEKYEKIEEFRHFYKSQYELMEKCDIEIGNWELYVSDIPLSLEQQ